MSIRRLWQRWRRRLAGRRRQKRLYRETGLEGHLKMAARHGFAMRKLRSLIVQMKAQIAPGPMNWAGSKWIVRDEVDPLAERRGIPKTSGKRSETFGNPGSDHFIGNTSAFGRDYGTANDYDFATEIRRTLSRDPNAVHQDYESFYIWRYGFKYRVQIIAATHGTGPHLHLGVERVG